MANEITVNGSLVVKDSTSPAGTALQSGDVSVSPAAFNRTLSKMSVATTPTAIPVTGITTPGWAVFINRDPTNYIDLYTDNGGSKKAFARLMPGVPCGPIFLGTDAKAPYAQAHTGACEMEFLILDS